MGAAAPYRPETVRAGSWSITALTDGFLRLDGGSMWGVVPKTMWSAWTPADSDNTIRLALRPFLAERDGERVLVEGGIGGRWEPKWQEIYGIERATTLVDALGACGVAPDEVTHVVLSHCHFDHVGALVVEGDRGPEPLFPRARHLAPRVEVDVALHPDHVRRASYRPDDLLPLREAGLLETFDATCDLLPGLRAHAAPGHSDGLCAFTLGEDEPGDTAVFWADVVPTTHHIQPAYIMAYDIDVPRSYESRSGLLARAADEGWIGLFYHDEERPFGRVVRDGKRYALEPVEGEQP